MRRDATGSLRDDRRAMNLAARTPNRALTMTVLLIGAFVSVMNMSVTNVALPSIAADLGAEGSGIAWISDSFTIALTSFVLIAGAVGDRYGRRQMFLLGACLTVPGSLVSAWAPTAGSLIVARAFTGVAVAMLFPTTLSFITSIYTDATERMKAIGLWAGVASAGAAFAPVVAGLLLEHVWWGSVFVIGAPIALVALVLGWFGLPLDGGAPDHAVDWVGGVYSVVFVGSLLFTVIEWPISGLEGKVLAGLVVAVVSGALFVRHELRAQHPLLDLRILRVPRFGIAALTVTLVFFGSFGYSFLSSQFFQNVLDYSPLAAGLAGLPMSVGMLVMSQVAAKLDLPWGSNRVIALGLIAMAASFALAALWGPDTAYLPIGFGMLLLGVGVGLTGTPTTNAIMNSLPPEQAGIGSAVNDVTRDFGGALGIALFGAVSAVFYSRYVDRLVESLPSEVTSQVSDDIVLTVSRSLNGALGVAERYAAEYPELSAGLVEAAGNGWLAGQAAAMWMGGLVCLVLSGFVYRFMPRAEA
jgi:EmrB/QacA subfamily drug resistance transporter